MWIGDLEGIGPVYRQLYRAIRAAILDRRLRPGERLPSTRWIADDSGVSRNRVLLAYLQLIDEGYAVGRPGSGTFVAPELPDEGVAITSASRIARRQAAPRLSRFAARVMEGELDWSQESSPPLDFHYGRPSLDDFPHSIWRRLVARGARDLTLPDIDCAPAAAVGLSALREAIAGYLSRWRGVSASSDQIVVTNGSQQALNLVARLVLNPGDCAAIEDPHYVGARLAFLGAEADIVGIPVDGQGLDVTALIRSRRRPKLIYVTPSHQFPTGAVLPLARRLALLRYAERVGAYVIEDDYDSEYRYGSAPLESLHGLDRGGRVLYVGTFSKILFPALRVGYVVAPPKLAPVLERAKTISDFGNSLFEQRVLAEFIGAGHLDVHVRRSRRRHAARRRLLLEELTRVLGDRIEVLGADAGLHIVVVIGGLRSSVTARIVTEAKEHGVGVYGTQPYYLGESRGMHNAPRHGALSEDEIREGVKRLGAVIARHLPTQARK